MPKFVIEREIPNAGNSRPKNCELSHKNLAECCTISARRSSGCKVMSPTTRFTASTSRQTRRCCKNTQSKAAFRLIESQGQIGNRSYHRRAITILGYFFLCPNISPRMVRGSRRVRRFSIAGVSSEMCGISQRCSAMNQIDFSVAIQWRRSKRARLTARE